MSPYGFTISQMKYATLFMYLKEINKCAILTRSFSEHDENLAREQDRKKKRFVQYWS